MVLLRMRFANQLYTDGVITVGKPSVAWMVEKTDKMMIKVAGNGKVTWRSMYIYSLCCYVFVYISPR